MDRSTALDSRGNELFGGTDLVGDLNATRLLRWDRRLVKVTSTGASAALIMPETVAGTATPWGRGGTIFWLWQDGGTDPIPVADGDAGSVGTLGVDELREVILLTDDVGAGTWHFGAARTVTEGGNVPGGGILNVTKVFDEFFYDGFRIADWLVNEFGWNRVDPVQVTLVVEAGIAIGAPRNNAFAIDTGHLPDGSTVYLLNNGTISGAAGAGGDGGIATGATVATDGDYGGFCLHLRAPAASGTITVNIDNQGTIQGGGGGGGGGGYGTTASAQGGGGGGGAGFLAGRQGVGVGPATWGFPGRLTAGGAGGSPGTATGGSGGAGGGPGAAGSAGSGGTGSGSGGAAGYAVYRHATGVVRNWINTGTVYGGELTY